MGWHRSNRLSPREDGTEPLVGLLISRAKLNAVLQGRSDTVYCRYARYAREAGGEVLFFTVDGLRPGQGMVEGYLHACHGGGRCGWTPALRPVPRTIYDRAFGREGRLEGAIVRAHAAALGAEVLNRPVKITKLQAFEALVRYPELRAYLPHTVHLTESALREAMRTCTDLYLKPDALYKGKGVCRLVREGGGWALLSREEWGNACWHVPDGETAIRAVFQRVDPEAQYLLQEGLPLATYLGNRFDFRALLQRDGRGAWQVTGLVARVAPQGSVITSPRSGGLVAPPDRVLRHAFGERWEQVMADLEAASVTLARRVDAELGPCIDLGLDLGVGEDGTVRLIEVNGKPLRVSLERLWDPAVVNRIHRCPIHHLCWRALGKPQVAPPETAEPHAPPRVGMMLPPGVAEQLQGPRGDAYRAAAREAKETGIEVCFFDLATLEEAGDRLRGWVLTDDGWRQEALPLPEVIYNRATYREPEQRRRARNLLRRLTVEREVVLLNSANSFSKLQVQELLTFFSGTASLALETAPLNSELALAVMLSRHPVLFLKTDTGSHGSDVLRVFRSGDAWRVQGRAGGRVVRESFRRVEEIYAFCQLVRGRQSWVMQEGMTLPEIDGRVFDVRAIAQKDGRGEWAVPLVLVRLAAPGSVAANMSQGGQPFLPAAFREQYGHQFPHLNALEETASAVAIRVAEVLESRFGMLGEVGVDIGLDVAGRPRVFEANAKPLHPLLPDLPQPLLRYPLQYAAHLARRARSGRETGYPIQASSAPHLVRLSPPE